MGSRGLVVAVVVFLAAGSLYYFGDLRSNKNPSPAASPLAAPVFGLSANQVQAVRIKAKGKILTVTRTKPAEWTYSLCTDGQATCNPDPADTAKAQALAASVAELRPTGPTIFGAPAGLPAYGLDAASTAEIQVSGGAGDRTLLIGAKTPDQGYYYGRRTPANDIFTFTASVIDAQFLNAIDAPPRVVPSPSPSPAAPVGPTLPTPSPSA